MLCVQQIDVIRSALSLVMTAVYSTVVLRFLVPTAHCSTRVNHTIMVLEWLTDSHMLYIIKNHTRLCIPSTEITCRVRYAIGTRNYETTVLAPCVCIEYTTSVPTCGAMYVVMLMCACMCACVVVCVCMRIMMSCPSFSV